MKLALLVLGCFVCASQQERYVWPFPIDPNQAAYKPLYYSDGLPAGYDVVKKSDVNPKVKIRLYISSFEFEFYQFGADRMKSRAQK
jgi:hypothetical protein